MKLFKDNGVADVGFTMVEDGPFGSESYAVSIVIKLSDAVIDEITDEPTHTYFHHYRTVNAFIDRVLLQAGFMLERAGYRYIPVGA
ncbi:MAG: epoxyqueuosine reductase, partial [Clostridia bacterium]|nr:epoxyqueuosine reductase [Clostridia bacterium]